MRLGRTRTTSVTFVLGAIFATAVFAAAAQAAILPLRAGTVVSKTDVGAFTYFRAVDEAGKEFWVITSICTIGEKGKIAVLAGTRYDRLKSDHLQAVIEDVYTAQLLRIGASEVKGFGAHGLPTGCVMME